MRLKNFIFFTSFEFVKGVWNAKVSQTRRHQWYMHVERRRFAMATVSSFSPRYEKLSSSVLQGYQPEQTIVMEHHSGQHIYGGNFVSEIQVMFFQSKWRALQRRKEKNRGNSSSSWYVFTCNYRISVPRGVIFSTSSFHFWQNKIQIKPLLNQAF